MILQVTAEGGADGGTQLPIKGNEQVTVQEVTVDAHVIHLGHISTLSGEHHLSGGVINAGDRRARYVAGTHRFPSTRVDLIARARGRPQRGGARVSAEDSDGVMNVRSVPEQKLLHALGRAEKPGGALYVAMRDAASGGLK